MGRVVHFEVHCADVDRAEGFYREVFGWEIQRYEGAPIDYRLVTTGPDDETGINGAIIGRRGGGGADPGPGQRVLVHVPAGAVDGEQSARGGARGRPPAGPRR